MTGPKLDKALQGLQEAIAALDDTIVATSDKLAAQQGGGADSGPAEGAMPAEKLRAELDALQALISQATAMINAPDDEVVH